MQRDNQYFTAAAKKRYYVGTNAAQDSWKVDHRWKVLEGPRVGVLLNLAV